MISKKDKFRLRALANPLKPIVIIGKEGLTENIISSINDAIKTHELIKISILNNSFVTVDEVVEFFAQEEIEFVQKIGRVIVFYKASENAVNADDSVFMSVFGNHLP